MFQLPKSSLLATQAIALTCTALLGAWAMPCAAASISTPTVSSTFNVSVTLIPAPVQPTPVTPGQPVIVPPGLPVSAFCIKDNLPSAHGAVVTVVCSTGVVVNIEPGRSGQPLTPMHGGAYRYVTHVTPNGALLNTADAFSGAGTTTAWRVVHLTGRDYLEMTLGW